mgnify:CR=1 FL=1
MSFHEVRFPETLSFGSVGGPERRTDVVTLANGHEERNTPWAHARRRYDAGLGLRGLEQLRRRIKGRGEERPRVKAENCVFVLVARQQALTNRNLTCLDGAFDVRAFEQ